MNSSSPRLGSFLVAISFFIVMAVPRLQAADKAWNSTVNASWSTSTNWSPAGAPGELDNVVSPTATPTIGQCLLDTDVKVANWTLNNTSWLITTNGGVHRTVEITGDLVKSGGGNSQFRGSASGSQINLLIGGAFNLSGGELRLGDESSSARLRNVTVTGKTTIGGILKANIAGTAQFGEIEMTGGTFYIFQSFAASGGITTSALSGTTGTIAASTSNDRARAATLTINGSGITSYSGLIKDTANTGTGTTTLSLVKSGTGMQTLGGVNTYTGATTINAGTLLLSGSGSIANSSAINLAGSGAVFDVSAVAFTLQSGQILSGIGTVQGNVATASGSTLSPGNSPGTLNISGNLALGNSTNFAFELGDLVAVDGNLTLGTNLSLVVSTDLAAGNYDLFSYTGTLSNTGDLASWTASGLTNSYNFLSDGDSVYLSVVPESSTALMFGAGLIGLFCLCNRRKARRS